MGLVIGSADVARPADPARAPSCHSVLPRDPVLLEKLGFLRIRAGVKLFQMYQFGNLNVLP